MYTVFETNECLFPNCEEKNIKSHAISKSISLELISEDNHLTYVFPRQCDKWVKKPVLKKISTKKATAFNGFCKKHDDFFQKLDNNEIKTTKDVLLQTYRSICIILNEEKSASISTYGLNSFESFNDISNDEVIEYLNKNNFQPLLSQLDNLNILKVVKKKMFFEMEEAIDRDLSEIEHLSNYLKCVLDFWEVTNIKINELRTITSGNMEYVLYFYKTDFQIPVSVNAINKAVFKGEKLNSYIVIIPYKNSSVIINVLPKSLLKDSDLNNKIRYYFTDSIKVIEFVESIISTCDGWYIKPSVVDSMEEGKKTLFIEDCMFITERPFLAQYDLTIFDELRKRICNELNYDYDKEKMKFFPERDPYQLRYKNMLESLKRSIVKA